MHTYEVQQLINSEWDTIGCYDTFSDADRMSETMRADGVSVDDIRIYEL